jgi:hypothetical protein
MNGRAIRERKRVSETDPEVLRLSSMDVHARSGSLTWISDTVEG